MKKTGIFLSLILLMMACQNHEWYAANWREQEIAHYGTLFYDVNPFDSSDSCLYLHIDSINVRSDAPAYYTDKFGKGTDFVLVQGNNALISIFDSCGNKLDSVFVYRYDYNYKKDSPTFPNVITDTCGYDTIGKIYIQTCPKIFATIPYYYEDDRECCINSEVGIDIRCSHVFSKAIEGKEYNFMPVFFMHRLGIEE